MEGKDYSATFQQDLEMLKYFQDEFQFRVQHYWNILIKLSTLAVIITIFPIASEVCGVTLEAVSLPYQLCFPTLGLVIAVFTRIILLKEAEKTMAANEAKYRINKQLMDQKYHYEFLDDNVGEGKSDKTQWMSYRIANYTFVFELVIVILVFSVILVKLALVSHAITV